MSLASVLLPEPDEPTIPTTWPARDIEAHIAQDLGAVDAIAKADMLEGHVAADRRKRGTARRTSSAPGAR